MAREGRPRNRPVWSHIAVVSDRGGQALATPDEKLSAPRQAISAVEHSAEALLTTTGARFNQRDTDWVARRLEYVSHARLPAASSPGARRWPPLPRVSALLPLVTQLSAVLGNSPSGLTRLLCSETYLVGEYRAGVEMAA